MKEDILLVARSLTRLDGSLTPNAPIVVRKNGATELTTLNLTASAAKPAAATRQGRIDGVSVVERPDETIVEILLLRRH